VTEANAHEHQHLSRSACPALFDPEIGDVTHVFASGIASRVPGGNFFLTAGRVDFAAHPGADFLLQPDVGARKYRGILRRASSLAAHC
jgi:hypothetical protein